MRRYPHFLPYLIACILAFVTPSVFAADYYTWTDDNGNLHISDSLSSVPQKYRSQTERRQFGNTPSGSGTGTEKGFSENSKPEKPQPEIGRNQAKKYEVPYTAYEGSARRIIVPARLNRTVTARLAIDTGAPETIISAPLAEKLGLYDNDHGKVVVEARGIGGSAPAVRTIIDTIEVGGAQTTFVPTTVTDKLSDAFDGLLGMDFVANYAVTIDSPRKVVVFQELPVNPEHPGGHDREWWTSLFREFASYRTRWKEYSERLDKKIRSSLILDSEDRERKEFADDQYREAGKLFDKLNQYARENSVPVHWKQY